METDPCQENVMLGELAKTKMNQTRVNCLVS